jgi:peptidoglycan/LPS O-acetylase OafA/YrhL
VSNAVGAGRIVALDGLRGAAALVVLVHHSLLTIPALNFGYYQGTASNAFAWIMTYTPLHLVWAGGEAVDVFFILSGFVLTAPILRRGAGRWRSYYPARLVRLYVPVVGAVAVAAALVLLVPRSSMPPGSSDWLLDHELALDFAEVMKNLTLVSPSWLNSPLWSLEWEVVFSLLLPLYVIIAHKARGYIWPAIAGAIALSTLGSALESRPLQYLPMFVIGSLLATARLNLKRTTRAWVLAAAVIGITARWWLAGLPHASTATLPIVLASASAIVAIAASGVPALETPLPQKMGRLSFSLYLVHEPVIVTFALVFPSSLVWLVPVVGIPVGLVAAYLFYLAVEKPSQMISGRVARWAVWGKEQPLLGRNFKI